MHSFKGTWRLVRLALRRDRIKLTVSLASVGIMMPMFVTSILEVVTGEDGSSEQIIALFASNPATRLFGLPTGGGLGELLMLRTFTMMAVIVALISTFTVIRHTRQNEENGRSELINASATGRYALLSSALVVAIGLNLVIAVMVYLGLLGGDLPTSGAWAMAIALSMVGIAFSVVAAFCAQFTNTSRSANSLASAAVGLGFLLSGFGSVLGSVHPSGLSVEPMWMIWLSPIGWAQMIYPFAGENWSMLWVFAIFAVLGVGLSIYLTSRRDVGSGMFESRPGKATASPSLLSLGGLIWRLQRGMFIGWFVSITLLGVVYGAVASSVEDLLSEADGMQELFVTITGSEQIILAFFAAILGVLGMMTLGYAAQAALRLRAEETRALEFLLSTQASRRSWVILQVGFILLSSAVILLASGVAAALVAALSMDSVRDMLGSIINGALVQLPAIMVVVGLVVAVFGLIPRYSSAVTWGVVAISILFGQFFGAMFNLPQWILNISSLAHTPNAPAEAISIGPVLILSLIALGLIWLGLAIFNRRDLALD